MRGQFAPGSPSTQNTGSSVSSTALRTSLALICLASRASMYPPWGPRVLSTNSAPAQFYEQLRQVLIGYLLAFSDIHPLYWALVGVYGMQSQVRAISVLHSHT